MPPSFGANSALANRAKAELFPEIQIAWTRNPDRSRFFPEISCIILGLLRTIYVCLGSELRLETKAPRTHLQN